VKRKYRILSSRGIDEKLYVNINGHNQYVFIRGKDINNPIILNLHGGPANPDAFFTYEFAQEITDEFTYVSWDQRGCGRTYYKNKHIDPKNESTDFGQAIRDVDELVNYLCKRFKKNKIVIMGHSYGSLLGASYVEKYPERVERYIGIGQSISIKDTQKMNYNEVAYLLKDDKKKSDKLTMAYKCLQESFSLENLMKFQRITLPCFVGNMPDIKQTNRIKLILSSPDLAFTDIKWLVGMLNLKAHYARNKKLLDYTLSANIYHIGNEYSVPMYFISGEYDKSCRVELLKKYFDRIIAPNKKIVIMKACGHSPQIDEPMLFAKEVKKLLQN
jgi:pimeloyl-ACP methyl ester carboxylesterase